MLNKKDLNLASVIPLKLPANNGIKPRSRSKTKGRRTSKPFLMIPREIMYSPQYAALRPHAKNLMFDLFAQFRGNNNGDFCAAWSVMQKRGWRSPITLTKSINGLLDAGFVEKTRQGGKNSCNLFAVTWLSIDECKGKLDAAFPPTNVASNKWKKTNH